MDDGYPTNPPPGDTRLGEAVYRFADDVLHRPYYVRRTWRCVATAGAPIEPSPDDIVGELVV